MTLASRPLWKEGMLLLQQNFQLWDAYWSELLDLRLRCHSAFGWGYADLAIDEIAVARGSIRIVRALGVFENGHLFHFNTDSGLGRDICPQPLDVGQILGPQNLGTWVYLAIPRVVQGGTNVGRATDRSGLPPAFIEGTDSIADFVDGVDSQQVPVMRPNYVLLTDKDDLSSFQALKLVYVERQASGFSISPERMPPLLAISASASLTKLLGNLLADLAATLRAHKEKDARLLRESRPIMGDDLRRILRYHSIESYLPLGLMYYGSTISAHPYDVFNWLLLMSSAVAAGRAGEMRTESLPTYDHNDPFDSMNRLVESIGASLSDIPQQLVEKIDPEDTSGGMYRYSLANIQWVDQALLYVRLRSEASPQKTIDRFRGSAKIAPEEMITQIMSFGLQGIRFDLDSTPPAALEKRSGDIFFRVDRSDTLWAKLIETRRLCISMPASGDAPAELTLWAVATGR